MSMEESPIGMVLFRSVFSETDGITKYYIDHADDSIAIDGSLFLLHPSQLIKTTVTFTVENGVVVYELSKDYDHREGIGYFRKVKELSTI